MIVLQELQQLIEKSDKIIEEKFSSLSLFRDSANYQTKSTKDFDENTLWANRKGLKFIAQLSHAGRKINVYEVTKNLKSVFFGLSYIEISEPKPGKIIPKNNWEYISYVVSNYDEFLENDKKTARILQKIRTIGSDRFCYFLEEKFAVQFRNKSVSASNNFQEEKDKCSIFEDNLKEELTKEKEKCMKIVADFENYRRINEERLSKIKISASKEIILKLIEIIDDFERALKMDSFEGINSIYEKILTLIKEEGYEKIDIKAQDEFNPSFMEAITSVPAIDSSQNNKVQQVLQNGYRNINSNEIVKMARVVVAKK